MCSKSVTYRGRSWYGPIHILVTLTIVQERKEKKNIADEMKEVKKQKKLWSEKMKKQKAES